jgi:hypothetical protein
MHDLDHCNYIATNFCPGRPHKTAINQVNLIQLDPSNDDAPRRSGAFLLSCRCEANNCVVSVDCFWYIFTHGTAIRLVLRRCGAPRTRVRIFAGTQDARAGARSIVAGLCA